MAAKRKLEIDDATADTPPPLPPNKRTVEYALAALTSCAAVATGHRLSGRARSVFDELCAALPAMPYDVVSIMAQYERDATRLALLTSEGTLVLCYAGAPLVSPNVVSYPKFVPASSISFVTVPGTHATGGPLLFVYGRRTPGFMSVRLFAPARRHSNANATSSDDASAAEDANADASLRYELVSESPECEADSVWIPHDWAELCALPRSNRVWVGIYRMRASSPGTFRVYEFDGTRGADTCWDPICISGDVGWLSLAVRACQPKSYFENASTADAECERFREIVARTYPDLTHPIQNPATNPSGRYLPPPPDMRPATRAVHPINAGPFACGHDVPVTQLVALPVTPYDRFVLAVTRRSQFPASFELNIYDSERRAPLSPGRERGAELAFAHDIGRVQWMVSPASDAHESSFALAAIWTESRGSRVGTLTSPIVLPHCGGGGEDACAAALSEWWRRAVVDSQPFGTPEGLYWPQVATDHSGRLFCTLVVKHPNGFGSWRDDMLRVFTPARCDAANGNRVVYPSHFTEFKRRTGDGGAGTGTSEGTNVSSVGVYVSVGPCLADDRLVVTASGSLGAPPPPPARIWSLAAASADGSVPTTELTVPNLPPHSKVVLAFPF